MGAAVATAAGRPDTFPKYLIANAERIGKRPAIREKQFGIWQTYTWAEAADTVKAFAVGLAEKGVGPGQKIAVVGRNRPRLYWTFVAAQSLGAVPVPVYADSVAEEMAFVLNHAEVTAAVCEDQEQVDKVLSISDRLPSLKLIVYDEERGMRGYGHDHIFSFAEIEAHGRDILSRYPDREAAWRAGVEAGKGEDLAVILYTSGTTGQPKGVMLTHSNLITSAIAANSFDKFDENELVIAYLPLAWVGDHMFSLAQSYTAGFCVCCPESEETATLDRREIAPSYFFAPPRVFESMLTAILVRMEDAGPMKKKMFDFFMAHARRVGEDILDRKPVGLWDRFLYGLGEILVYGPLKNQLGMTRLRVGYTAGEAIGPEIFRFYRALGLNLKQLYGSTEASVYITMQPDGNIQADTVGLPAPGVEVKISDTGEVLFRSPGVFQGYYKNPEATAATKTPDGWVHSGDAGIFAPDGQLKIIDRAKDVGKLTDGCLFAPKYIENKLKFYPNIKEAVAFGDGRDYVTVFVNIDLTAVGNWAERNNISYASYQELAGLEQVYAQIQAHVEQVNRDLAAEPMMAGAQIRRFLVLHKELDADDGELTRTQKVRRRFIAERYGELIEALYDGSTSCHARTEVTFEDGRKGFIEADVKIRDARTFPAVHGREALPEAAE